MYEEIDLWIDSDLVEGTDPEKRIRSNTFYLKYVYSEQMYKIAQAKEVSKS